MSLAEATAYARSLALSYARDHALGVALVGVSPDTAEREKRGKIPVHWAAVFETVHQGKAFDGQVVFRLNLETGNVAPLEAL